MRPGQPWWYLYVTSSNLIMELMDDYMPNSHRNDFTDEKRFIKIYKELWKVPHTRKHKNCSGPQSKTVPKPGSEPRHKGSLLWTTTLNSSPKSDIFRIIQYSSLQWALPQTITEHKEHSPSPPCNGVLVLRPWGKNVVHFASHRMAKSLRIDATHKKGSLTHRTIKA